MAAIITASINIAKIPKEKYIAGKNGAQFHNITITLNDESKFGNNVAITDAQTIEEREAKKPRNYLGNGKVVWTNNQVKLAVKDEVKNDDLPF